MQGGAWKSDRKLLEQSLGVEASSQDWERCEHRLKVGVLTLIFDPLDTLAGLEIDDAHGIARHYYVRLHNWGTRVTPPDRRSAI
jgi:hypothetical protein